MGRKKKSLKHLTAIFFATFFSAALVGSGAEFLTRHTTSIVAWILLLIVMAVGILFDIIGTAATAATEAPHHSRAANRIHGSRQAVYIVRNADTVANFTNDIVGDVAGTLSGAMAASIVIDIVRHYEQLQPQEIWLNTIMLALVASLTVSGKAWGKTFAINDADEIVSAVGGILATIERITGRNFTDRKRKGGKRSGDSRKD